MYVQSNSFSFLLIVFLHFKDRSRNSTALLCYAGSNWGTGMLSLLRSKEANIRLSQPSWAWLRRKCKHHDSTQSHLLLFTKTVTQGESQYRTFWAPNTTHIHEKLWKPVPCWLCWSELLLVQRVGDNSVPYSGRSWGHCLSLLSGVCNDVMNEARNLQHQLCWLRTHFFRFEGTPLQWRSVFF